jgi:hypothetical protein
MSEKSESLKPEDVVSISDPNASLLLSHPTFRLSEFLSAITGHLGARNEPKSGWFGDGVKVEVLTIPSTGWRKGKIRLTVEFIPDEEPVEGE